MPRARAQGKKFQRDTIISIISSKFPSNIYYSLQNNNNSDNNNSYSNIFISKKASKTDLAATLYFNFQYGDFDEYTHFEVPLIFN